MTKIIKFGAEGFAKGDMSGRKKKNNLLSGILKKSNEF